MIADWDTDHLYLSNLLENREPVLFASLRAALDNVPIDIIHSTSDIWCRDYTPVQLNNDSFCQFVYAPDYLREDPHLMTPSERCRLPFMENYQKEPIILDGGNVVASRTKVILTDKIYKENPTISRPRLRERLEEVFNAECIIIPKEPYDRVGHADGVVRFVAEDRVLINDYTAVDPGYGARLRTFLEKKGLDVDTLPMFEEKTLRRRPGDLPSAVGIYINYLRVGNLVLVPTYDRPEDELALKKVKGILPDATVLQLPCRSLAEKGGVLNCISWTIKKKTATVNPSEA